MIESFERHDELQKIYPDPVAHFKNVAKERSAKKKSKKNQSINIDMESSLQTGDDNLKNVGYGIIKQRYFDLEPDTFWKWKTKGRQFQFNVEQIFRLLVFSRVLYPNSKKGTYDNRDVFFERFDGFSLDAVYDALDVFAEHQEALQKWIFDHSENLCKCDLSISYLDCTNYYFDSGSSDMHLLDNEGKTVDKNGNLTKAKYRKRGPEKNHRPDPIVSMALLMDKSGIPIAYDLFPGNITFIT